VSLPPAAAGRYRRPMSRQARVAAWLLPFVALSACGVAALGQIERTVQATAVYDGVGRVVIGHAAAGRVAVHGTAGSRAVVRTVAHARPAADPRIQATLVDGLLLLVTDCPDSSCSVDYDVTVPGDASVDVVQREGDVAVDHLAAALAIDVQGEGAIRLDSVSGPLRAATSLGDVVARRLSSPTVDVGSAFGGSVGLELTAPFQRVRVAQALRGGVDIRVPPGRYRLDVPDGTAVAPEVVADPAATALIEVTRTAGAAAGGDPVLSIRAVRSD